MRPVLAMDFAADCITAADFDLDGIPEVVLGRDESTQLRVCSLSGSEKVLRSQITLDSFPIALANADFDLDSRPELTVATVDGRVLFLVPDHGLNFYLTKSITLPALPRDLDVCMQGTRPFLTVATSTGIETIDPAQSAPDLPQVVQSVADAVEGLKEFEQQATYEEWLFQAGVTAREREVLGSAMSGLTAREIGSRLFIAERTVESHLAHAYSKLGVRSRFELLLRISAVDRATSRA